jgi:poly-gamma-glutamate synthesis protein (capsule biosynthesis protein)
MVVVVAALAFTLAFVNYLYARSAQDYASSKGPFTLVIDPRAAGDAKPMLDSYIKANPSAPIELSESRDPDLYIGTEPLPGYDASRFAGFPPLELDAGEIDKVLRPERDYWFCERRTGFFLKARNGDVADLCDYLVGYWDSVPTTSLAAVGDMIPSRHVAEQMEKRGVTWPFKRIAPLVRDADITLGSLECALSDREKPPTSGTYFIAPSEAIKGLEMLSLDVATLANNHSTDFGLPPLYDTISLLDKSGIEHCGGGSDFDEAHGAAYLEAGGTRFAFLSYNSIKDSIDAKPDEGGLAWISMDPYYPDNPADFEQVEEDVRRAKAQADFVIACFHWSKEYEYHPNPSMVSLAHKACDAGADMVIGQHPHTVQSVEYYKGKFITYCMGNFIFDQRFSEQVRQGYVLRCGLKKGNLVSLALLPYRINDLCQTVPYGPGRGQELLDKVIEVSGWRKAGTVI